MGKAEVLAKSKLFAEKVNKKYKTDGLVIVGSAGINLAQQRFSSGIFTLDTVLGGGWPFGRICLLAGEYSTGKTAISLLAAAKVQEYDKTTRVHKSRIKPESMASFTPCMTLFIDVEGAFDRKWGKKLGFDIEYNTIVTPEYGEQVVDIVEAAIREGIFDLIIIDSLAQMVPSKELEDSAEDQQMGIAARMNNKAFRKWQSAMTSMRDKAPCLLVLNQLREKIGVMFGDPRVLPGGKAQAFYSSITIWTRAAKIEDDEETKKSAKAILGGFTKKNKTFTPLLEFSWKLGLVNTEDYKAGEPINADDLINAAEQYDFLKKGADGYEFNKIVHKNLKEWKQRVTTDETVRTVMWRSLIKHICDILV